MDFIAGASVKEVGEKSRHDVAMEDGRILAGFALGAAELIKGSLNGFLDQFVWIELIEVAIKEQLIAGLGLFAALSSNAQEEVIVVGLLGEL